MDARDALTGLHDRRGFLERLREQIELASEANAPLALVVLDLDRFTQVNAHSGYAFGDQVLRHVASQVQGMARAHDIAARIGDNRFALILPRLLNRGHAELAVQKLFRLLDVPFESGDARVKVSATVGAAINVPHAPSAEVLLGKAEIALATARSEDRRFRFAPEKPEERTVSDRWDLEDDLGLAVERGEMTMHYQPQVRIADGRIAGVEALMRWNNPARGKVPPDLFIPIAERSGHIGKLTIWALNTVLRQTTRWDHGHGPLSVAVNLPSDMVAQPGLPELVLNAMHLFGSDTVRLMLEITERSLMEGERALEQLGKIRDLGVRISIDDFGTGYSCLAYFRNIPADELKIDKSFVAKLLSDPKSADITNLIVDLAHRFQLDVVGEGVEDLETLRILGAGGCDIAQGYLFARPMPADECEAWLRDFRPGDYGLGEGVGGSP